MREPALRLRLLLGSSLWIALALFVAGFAIAALFADHVEKSLSNDVSAQLDRLIALVDADATPLRLTQPMPDPRFEQPLSGLYWQIRDAGTGAILTSRSLWDQALKLAQPPPGQGATRLDHIADPAGGGAIAAARLLVFDTTAGGPRTLEIMVAETTRSLDAANAAFRTDLIRDLVILAIVLMLAAWLQVTLGLLPLAHIRRGVNAVRTGRAKRLDGRYPAEVLPLVQEVNGLLDTQETSIAFARARAADLAHGLKTNLTVLNVEAQALRRAGNEKSASAIEALTQELARTIDHQLALARLRHRSRSESYRTALAPLVTRVADTLALTPRGSALTWQIDIDPRVVFDIDQPDLVELLGILLENATNWANGRIGVFMGGEAGDTLVIEDDGPGLSAAQIERLGERGGRLDEKRSGTGIGLSIAQEIIVLNSGSLTFSRAGLGGLAVHVRLPGRPEGTP